VRQVFIVDQRQPAIGLIHSGKAGTFANVVGATLRAMAAAFGTAPANCRAVIGPSIGPCHYETGSLARDRAAVARRQACPTFKIRGPAPLVSRHVIFSYRAEKGPKPVACLLYWRFGADELVVAATPPV